MSKKSKKSSEDFVQLANVICPAPADSENYVELARLRTGRLFRKHILNKGPLIHPTTKTKINIDDAFIETLKRNFNNKVCDIVQAPKAGPNNEHSEDPDRNIGEIVGIEEDGDKVYALLDCRTEDADKLGKTLLGASALMHLNYEDTRTGQKVGPTLLHMAVTNRPYVLDLEDYEEVAGLTAEDSGDVVVLSSAPEEEPVETETDELDTEEDSKTVTTATELPEDEETPIMDLDELLTELKEEHGIDVLALQEAADSGTHSKDVSPELAAALSGVLAASGVLKLSNGEEASVDDIVGAISQLATDKVALSGRIDSLERDKAALVVDGYVDDGRILPKQRDAMLELYMSNSDLFETLLPEEPVVKLSNEQGGQQVDDTPEWNLDEEITRLTNVAKDAGYVR